jgi:DnaJ family protein C protein 7
LIDIENSLKKALEQRKFSDVMIYSSQLLNHCTDSVKCVGYRLEAMIGQNKVGEAIEYTTKFQH